MVNGDRIDKIEKALLELVKKVDTLEKTIVSNFSIVQIPTPTILGTESGKINPWVVRTSEALGATLKMVSQEIQESFSVYKKTIEALFRGSSTATEVSKITGRERNTESAYLKKLYISGYLTRVHEGKEVKYSISNEDQIRRRFNLTA